MVLKRLQKTLQIVAADTSPKALGCVLNEVSIGSPLFVSQTKEMTVTPAAAMSLLIALPCTPNPSCHIEGNGIMWLDRCSSSSVKVL